MVYGCNYFAYSNYLLVLFMGYWISLMKNDYLHIGIILTGITYWFYFVFTALLNSFEI